MTEEEIQKKVVDILVSDFECDRENLTPDVNLFTELDLDSIDAVDLVVRLQQVTKKKVNPESFRQIRTLRDVVQAVYELVNEPATATPAGGSGVPVERKLDPPAGGSGVPPLQAR